MLGFSSKKTMMIAQKLYEGKDINKKRTGLITYMRTDSLNISSQAINTAREYINKNFPKDLPEKPNFYKTKSSNAQEAHEAIRPTDPLRTPDQIKNSLTPDEFKIYSLI
jgi:DNA topoisomerase I